ncbi:ATP-binding cassette domain-containing protein [Alphaproteobacteria bacterium]|nr:ATP-binding cassette domain-containing protein [Alphaproteobacteria bacterium]
MGRNGLGKTTLLKLISGEFHPTEGAVQVSGNVHIQEHLLNLSQTIADALGVSEKLSALGRILDGEVEDSDFEMITDEDWNLEERIRQELSALNLTALDIQERRLEELSGGQSTQLMLVQAFLKNPDILLLDEPTNNLGSKSACGIL